MVFYKISQSKSSYVPLQYTVIIQNLGIKNKQRLYLLLFICRSNLRSNNFPDTDQVISVTSKQSSTIVRPGNRDWRWVLGFGLEVRVVLVQISNKGL